ncbi:cysteine desulfurase family protein [Runella slithyformis]|uniref:cysteine desulfurase n=1 Tax=Runella slithyformis (strain ATCC 29530 / DSM 19594 / LMG 11500 / NCIMB 11436 / LSU 4) TaxID=761193 RepID=A0A7U3ZQN0_RUNSL|nr:IscS subfamily cysteine desulfurase [Runella slithyformis]AEI51590.1 Cysteine desulfurase [Runella slithyformis DSM 19594]
MRLPVYLDYNATTPVDSRVLEAMLPWFSEHFGNAASRTHLYGWTAEEAVATARKQVAKLLKTNLKEVVFTSGATEANNLAIKGVFEKYSYKGKHIVTVATEHKAVLDTCHHCEQLGGEVTYLRPDTNGLITPQQVAEALRSDTILVSVMYANNEIGVIQPIREIAAATHAGGALFHTDATQAAGKLPIDMAEEGIDLLSLSAHKFYGPKGVGALAVRQGVELTAQLDGGGHERGRRSGTLNVPGIVGLGKACELAQKEMNAEAERLCRLRDRLEQEILANVPHTFVNGKASQRLAHLTNICFEHIDGENLLLSLKDIAVSTGSACTSASVLPSYVLKILGLTDDQAYASLRFSLGRFTTEEEIECTIQHVIETVERMRVGSAV